MGWSIEVGSGAQARRSGLDQFRAKPRAWPMNPEAVNPEAEPVITAHFPDDPRPRWHQPVLALGQLRWAASRPHEDHRPRAAARGGARRHAGGDDVRSASVAGASARQGAAAPDDDRAEARGVRPGRGCRASPCVRFTHELSRMGAGAFRADGARRLAARRRSVGRARTSSSATIAPARSRCFEPRRPLRLPRREDRSRPLQGLRRQQHAHPAARGRRPRGRGRSAARPSLLRRRHRDARRRPRTGARVPDGEPLHRQRARAAAGRVRDARDDRRRRPSVGHQHRLPPDVRRRRSRRRSKRTSSMSTAICTADSSGSRSCSGCATSGRFRMSTRCAHRSRRTAAARAGCSAGFRCRIVPHVSAAGSAHADRASVRAGRRTRFHRSPRISRSRSPSSSDGGRPTPRRRATPSRRSWPSVAPSGTNGSDEITLEFHQTDDELRIEARCAGRSSEVRHPLPT